VEFAFGRDWLHGDSALRQSERFRSERWWQDIHENFGGESFLLHSFGRSMGLLEPRWHHHGITNVDTRRSLCERKECRPLAIRWNHVDVSGRGFRLIALSVPDSVPPGSRKNSELVRGQWKCIANISSLSAITEIPCASPWREKLGSSRAAINSSGKRQSLDRRT